MAQNPSQTITKTSFDPISDNHTTILILGSLPGDKSIEVGEYYGHPRNRFWKIISTITNNPLPLSYPEKKQMLLKTGIGLWDVAHSAKRSGSLDTAIKEEVPNDIQGFILEHQSLSVIAFNGSKAEKMFFKYFPKNSDIKYISLPSSSPANAKFDFESLCKSWSQILETK